MKTPPSTRPMWLTAIIMTYAGLVVTLLALVLDWATLTLLGLLLLIAGLATTAMVWIWIRLAKLGTDQHRPEQAS